MPDITAEIKAPAGAVAPKVPSTAIPAIDDKQIKKLFNEMLAEKREEVAAAAQPKEPDWATLTEEQYYDPSIYIPVIEHDVPSYMDMKLADPEYVAKWANVDQRRIGQLLAEGYELLRKEHVHKDFICPLKWDSEGNYRYGDVICVRVHKRIDAAKKRRAQQLSDRQLRPQKLDEKVGQKLGESISGDPVVDMAFNRGQMGFFTPTDSNY